MSQVLRAGALGRPRGMGWRGRREGGLGWGTHINPWLIHVNIWQKSLQYCKVISLQLIRNKSKKKKKNTQEVVTYRIDTAQEFYIHKDVLHMDLALGKFIFLKQLSLPLGFGESVTSRTCYFVFHKRPQVQSYVYGKENGKS